MKKQIVSIFLVLSLTISLMISLIGGASGPGSNDGDAAGNAAGNTVETTTENAAGNNAGNAAVSQTDSNSAGGDAADQNEGNSSADAAGQNDANSSADAAGQNDDNSSADAAGQNDESNASATSTETAQTDAADSETSDASSKSADVADDAIVFETIDTEGNTVSSQDIFSQHTLTMVNLWGTFCGPCIREMPDLEILNQRLSEKGCGLIGVVLDVAGPDDTAQIDLAKEIMVGTGVTYMNLLPWETINEDLVAIYIPTTYFIDSNGQIVGEAAVGSRSADDYEALIDELLAGME